MGASLAKKRKLLKKLKQKNTLLARRDLLEFILEVRPNFKVNFHHAIICERLTRMISETGQRIIITLPPQYGKSEIISRCLPAFALGKTEGKAKIIMASYAASLASTFNRAAQDVMDLPEYRQIFPKAYNAIRPRAARKWKRTQDLCETSKHGYLYSVGVGGSTTGRSADPILIVDDPFKDWKDALSPTIRQTVIDWFGSVIESRLSLSANVIIMHTRWHEGDLAGHLLKKALEDKEATQWELLNFPALVEDLSELHPDDPRGMGEALWPEHKGDPAKLNRIKKDVGTYIFSALWQQRPRSASGNIVDPAWWRYYRVLPAKFDEVILSIDCSFKDFSTSDYVVLQVWGRIGVDKYLIDQRRDQMDVIKTCNELINLKVKYDEIDAVFIEDTANGPAVIQLLKGKVSGLIPVTPEDSKIARTYTVGPQIESGNVWLPHESIAPFDVGKFVEEWSNFPLGANDDQVDAGSQALSELSRNENHYLKQLLKKD